MTTPSQSPLRIAFLGMSGSGKTFWAFKLSAAGYPTICCDDRIEQRLRPHLPRVGRHGIEGVAAWMGWPDSPHYAEREALYLREEIAVLGDALAHLEKDPQSSLILDATGSVIYAGDALLHRLREQLKIVHLAAAPEDEQLLVERYLRNPKPVLWRGAFRPLPGEASQDTVKRCYPALIAERKSRYKALAHCTIPIRRLRDTALDAAGFLALIEQAMARELRCNT
jgi:shikimate kinase